MSDAFKKKVQWLHHMVWARLYINDLLDWSEFAQYAFELLGFTAAIMLTESVFSDVGGL